MNNPFTKIIEDTGKKGYQLLDDELKGVVSHPTLYNLLDKKGIPPKTRWGTILKVALALGYEVVFQPKNNSE